MARGELMDKLKHVGLKHILIALLLLFVLVKVGVIPRFFAIQGNIQGDIPCTVSTLSAVYPTDFTCYAADGTTVATCPTSNCVGSFTLAQRNNVTDCETLTTEPDKSSCKLTDGWYNFQGGLATVKCVDKSKPIYEDLQTQANVPTGWYEPVAVGSKGVLQVSPYCILDAEQVSDWIKANPLVWARENPWLAIGLLIVFVVVLAAFLPDKIGG